MTRCFSIYNSDSMERRKYSTSGFCTLAGRYFISRGGVVAGVRYGDHLRPEYALARSEDELSAFSGSKYVQSFLDQNFLSLCTAVLEEGKELLFIGLPCQVDMARKSLEGYGAQVTYVDLLCHGVVPFRYFREEIDYLSSRSGKEVTDVRFRENGPGDYRMTLMSGDTPIYSKPSWDQPYYKGYVSNITLRESCFSCRFSVPERCSDITAGDFISRHSPNGCGNLACIIVSSERGLSLLQEVLEAFPQLVCTETDLASRMEYGNSIASPSLRSPLRDRFLKYEAELGFPLAIRKTLGPGFRFAGVNEAFVRLKRKMGITTSIFRKK